MPPYRVQGSAFRLLSKRLYSTPAVVQTCPEPTCPCAPTPTGLNIDRDAPLGGMLPPYTQHVVVYTGKSDWASRIEEDATPARVFVKALKEKLGRGGNFADPFNNIMVTMSSFSPKAVDARFHDLPFQRNSASVLIFPRSIEVPKIPITQSGVDDFIRAYLQPEKLHRAHDTLGKEKRNLMTRDRSLESHFHDVLPIKASPTILICSHNTRDVRCGIMGPLLRSEFERVILQTGGKRINDPAVIEVASTEANFNVLDAQSEPHVESGSEADDIDPDEDNSIEYPWARIGLISHIGGHKFAGNIIIYVPDNLAIEGGGISPLAGHGIWYGRVEPRHVEGIVKETIMGGKIIKELFRGAIHADGELLHI